jgi:outer membrane lipoprotein-sorting protein
MRQLLRHFVTRPGSAAALTPSLSHRMGEGARLVRRSLGEGGRAGLRRAEVASATQAGEGRFTDWLCHKGVGLAAGGILFWAAAGVMAQPTNPPAAVSLEDISRAMAKADTVFSRFTQERHLSLFNEPLRSEGYLCFQKPGRVRWETTRPYKSILVSDGRGVAQFEWVDDKWRKLDLGLADALQNVVAQIAGVMEGRYTSDRRSYAASVTNSADGPVITLVPRDQAMRKMLAAIEVHLAPDLQATRRVVLRETGGDTTDIRFSEQVVGLVLPEKTFDRSAPVAIEQVRAASGRK